MSVWAGSGVHLDWRLTNFCVDREADPATLAAEIQDKSTEDVEKYLKVFRKKAHTLAGMIISFF